MPSTPTHGASRNSAGAQPAPETARAGSVMMVEDWPRLLATLAYALSMTWFGAVLALPIYAWARRRRRSFVTWHALQATSISLWVGAVMLLLWFAGLDRAWPGPGAVANASDWVWQLGLLAAGPRYLVFGISGVLCGAGMTEALCGRKTSLPLVHGLADRYGSGD